MKKVVLPYDGDLSYHHYHKNGRKFIRILELVFLFIIVTLSLFSCKEENDLFDEVSIDENNSLAALETSLNAVSGWVDQGTNIDGGIRKYYNSSKEWYILKVYLPEIQIKPVYRITSGSGTTNPTFTKKSVSSWISDSKGNGADVLINASFFNLNGIYGDYGLVGTKAEVAHPFGFNNSVISQGYAFSEYGQKRLRINNMMAYIETPVSSNYFETLVTGYDPAIVNKDKNSSIGRTMIGTSSNGSNILYFFVTGDDGGATQAEAISALQSFGCTRYVMLDGSGSSQMAWNGSILVDSSDPLLLPDRKIPCVLRMDNR